MDTPFAITYQMGRTWTSAAATTTLYYNILAANTLAYTPVPADTARVNQIAGTFAVLSDKGAASRLGRFILTDHVFTPAAFAGVFHTIVSAMTVFWTQIVVLAAGVAYTVSAGRFGGIHKHHRPGHEHEQAEQHQATQDGGGLLQDRFLDDHQSLPLL